MIAKFQRRVLIIVVAFAVWCLVGMWLVFGLHVSNFFEQHRAFYFVLAFLAILPVFFFPSLVKRVPRFRIAHAVALAILAVGEILISVGTIAVFVLNLDNVWTDSIFGLGRAFMVLTSLIFIGLGLKSARAKGGAGVK
jgi:hypothetical protein